MDERTRAQLEARTERFGAAVEARSASRELGRYVGFRVGDTILGVPVAVVHEFAPLAQWVPLAGRRNVLGIAQLRGEVMALVDLGQALLGRRSPSSEWIVVLEGRGGRTAAPVDEVLGTRGVLEDELCPAGQVPPPCPAVTGTTRDLWHLLDAAAVAAALDAEVASGGGDGAAA